MIGARSLQDAKHLTISESNDFLVLLVPDDLSLKERTCLSWQVLSSLNQDMLRGDT